MTTRKTARAKLPDEPRKLGGKYRDTPLPFDTAAIEDQVKRTRREQGLSEVSERKWQ